MFKWTSSEFIEMEEEERLVYSKMSRGFAFNCKIIFWITVSLWISMVAIVNAGKTFLLFIILIRSFTLYV